MRISRRVLSCHVVAEVVGFDDEEESSSSRRGEYQQCNAKSFGSVSSATPKCLLWLQSHEIGNIRQGDLPR